MKDLKLEQMIESRTLKIAIFGLGRIGLPTALMFCRGGYIVHGIDINQKLLDDLQMKKTFIDEPGLPELLDRAVDEKLIDGFSLMVTN